MCTVLTLLEEAVVGQLDLDQCISHSLMESVRFGIVQNQLQHFLKLVSRGRHNIVPSFLKFNEEFRLDTVG